MKKYRVKATQYVYWDAYVKANSPEEAYEKAKHDDAFWIIFSRTGQSEWEIYSDSVEEVEDGKD
tara:strand:+ start:385 stop:576 length:192 start_codon:yes stop_codon:yes gene_type:complete